MPFLVNFSYNILIFFFNFINIYKRVLSTIVLFVSLLLTVSAVSVMQACFIIIIAPLIFMIGVFFIDKFIDLKFISLLMSILLLILCFKILFFLSLSNTEFFIISFYFKPFSFFFWSEHFSSFTFDFIFNFNKVSVLFVLLTLVLVLICILLSWNWLGFYFSIKSYIFFLFFLEFACICFFLSFNLILFYFFFESVLIPMFFLIGVWGLRDRKIHAVYQFFIYTFFGSLFMLISILIILVEFGNFNFFFIEKYWWFFTTNFRLGLFIWFCFFISFAIKIPMVPFHIWLPEAHVEAPTAGSIILAGILLKFGTYGFFRILLFNFLFGFEFFKKFIIVLSLIAILYGSLITYVLIDLKKIIAYSSISHMGYVTLGVTLDNIEGITGSLFMMLTHGFISGGLFYIVGILYERYGTRNIFYYSSLKNIMPLYTFYFFLFTLANLNLPLTGGFIAELLVLLGTGTLLSKFISFFSCLGLFTNGVYCIWLFNRLCFGKLFFKDNFINNNNNNNNNNVIIFEYQDLTIRENFILNFLLFFIILLGVIPTGFLEFLEKPVLSFLWLKHLIF